MSLFLKKDARFETFSQHREKKQNFLSNANKNIIMQSFFFNRRKGLWPPDSHYFNIIVKKICRHVRGTYAVPFGISPFFQICRDVQKTICRRRRKRRSFRKIRSGTDRETAVKAVRLHRHPYPQDTAAFGPSSPHTLPLRRGDAVPSWSAPTVMAGLNNIMATPVFPTDVTSAAPNSQTSPPKHWGYNLLVHQWTRWHWSAKAQNHRHQPNRVPSVKNTLQLLITESTSLIRGVFLTLMISASCHKHTVQSVGHALICASSDFSIR